MNKKFKKIALLLALMMGFNTVATASLLDLDGHWGQTHIAYLNEKEIINGYGDGTFKPNNPITRAEFFKIINSIFKYQDQDKIGYIDVKENSWYREDIAKGEAAGYLSIYDGKKIEPNKFITREEVASILAQVYRLEGQEKKSKTKIKDLDKVSPWALDGLMKMVDLGYMEGYGDSTIKPKGEITRAEASKLIKSVTGEIINKPGKYKQKLEGNILINSPGVILDQSSVKGNLYLTGGANGDKLEIRKSDIKGKVYIGSGAANRLDIVDSSLGQVLVEGKTQKEDSMTIDVRGKSKIDLMDLGKTTDLKLAGESQLSTLKLDRASHLSLEGRVDKLEIRDKASQVDIRGQGIVGELKTKDSVKVNGDSLTMGNYRDLKAKETIKESIKEPTRQPSSGGGGGGGGGSSPIERPSEPSSPTEPETKPEKPLINRVKKVIDLIDQIPANMSLEDELGLDTIRLEYNSLLEQEKISVTNIDKLVRAELQLEDLKIKREADSFRESYGEILSLGIDGAGIEHREDVIEAISKKRSLSPKVRAELEEERLYLEDLLNHLNKIIDEEEATIVEIARLALETAENTKIDGDISLAEEAILKIRDEDLRGEMLLALDNIKNIIKEDQLRAEADKIKAMIGDLVDRVGLSMEDIKEIKGAIDAYNEFDKDLDDKSLLDDSRIEDLLEILDKLETEATYHQEAEEFESILDSMTYDKETIIKVLDQYDKLEEDVKKYIDPAKLAGLRDILDGILADEDKYRKDREKADQVSALIDGLGSSLSLSDRDQVVNARASYDGLTESQKTLVDEASFKNLLEAEKTIEKLEEEERELQELIREFESFLAEIPKDISLEIRDQVQAARILLDRIRDFNRDVEVSGEDKLILLEKEILSLEEEAKKLEDIAKEELEKLKVEKTREQLELTRSAVDIIRDSSLKEDLIKEIAAIEREIDKIEHNFKKASEVEILITSLNDPLTIDDLIKVKEARDKYNTLTQDQKDLIENQVLDLLINSEEEVKAIKEDLDRAANFDQQISSIEKINLDNIELLEKIIEDYSSLSERQRSFIKTNEQLEKIKKELLKLNKDLDDRLEEYAHKLNKTKSYYNKENQEKIIFLLDYKKLTGRDKLDRLNDLESFIENTEFLTIIGDEVIGDLNIVNRDYRDNSVKKAEIGDIKILLGEDRIDLTEKYDIKYFSPQGNEEITTINLSDGAKTVKVLMKAEAKDNLLPNIEEYVYIKYRSVLCGDEYYTIEDALDLKGESKLVVAYNTSFSDQAISKEVYGKTSYSLAEQSSLLLPYNDDHLYDIDNAENTLPGIKRNSAYVELVLSPGIQLDIYGNFTINARRSNSDTKYQGHTEQGSYSQLQLAESSKINVHNSGRLNSIGYIYGEGIVEAFEGSVICEPMFIKSFRGGTATTKISSDIFPFDQYTVNNIETDLIINSGAKYELTTILFMRNHIKAKLDLVGSDDNSLIKIIDGKIIKTYDPATASVNIDIYGRADINNISLNVVGLSIDSKGKDIPFDGTWSLRAKAGSDIRLNSSLMLLPGSSLEIEEEAELRVVKDNKITVFNPYEHLDDYNKYPNKGVEKFYRLPPKFNYNENTPADLIVNGKLIIEEDGGLAGRVKLKHDKCLELSPQARVKYNINFVSGVAGKAKVNSRQVQLFTNNQDTIYLFTDKNTVVRKNKEDANDDKNRVSITAVVKDKSNQPQEGIEIKFEGGKGEWTSPSVKTGKDGRASTVYTSRDDVGDKIDVRAINLSNNQIADIEISIVDKEESCPFVYSYDGKDYHFEHEPVSYSTSQALENTSYGTLRKLSEVDGKYKIRVTEEKDSLTFVNGVKLFAIDYREDDSKEVFVDINGLPHTIVSRELPKSFIDDNNKSWLDEISTDDIISSNIDLYESESNTATFQAVFDRPKDMSDQSKFMISARATSLVDGLAKWFYDFLDGENNIWWLEKALEKSPYFEKLIDAMGLVNLDIELWDGKAWIKQGEIELGSHLMEEFLVPIDIGSIDEDLDQIKIRVRSGLGFFEIDKLSMDFSDDEIEKVTEMKLISAKKKEEEVSSIVNSLSNDKRVRLEKGDYLDLYYDVEDLEEGLSRGFMVEFKGYFHPLPNIKENNIVDKWGNKTYDEILKLAVEEDPDVEKVLPALEFLNDLVDLVYMESMDYKVEKVMEELVIPWLYSR